MTDAPEVGAKAASLGELLATGYRVPDGLVLAAEAADLPAEDRRSLIETAAASLGPGPFAVRSSGVTEDGLEHSFAGMYETVLDVRADGLGAATDRVLASADAVRATTYESDGASMAVLVQRMVAPAAAGVALTADPVSGDRLSTVVTAVRGVGERLVSGAAIGDEWVVRDGTAKPRRQPERAIDARQAIAVAAQARRIAAARGMPQDIEWAIDDAGELWVIQARPMTALPPDVSWESPAPGAFSRTFRFGEWIGAPVTPLFESWLLPAMEARLHAVLLAGLGQRAPLPHHVVINGWYFYSLNWFSGRSLARSLPGMVKSVIREPKRAGGVFPPTVRFSFPLFERDWREDLQPRYRAAVADAETRVEQLPVSELPGLIDSLADEAGAYFANLVALAGAAYKMEMNLALFYRRHLARKLGGSHLALVTGIERPAALGRHAVTSLDWWYPLAPMQDAAVSEEDSERLAQARHTAEEQTLAALADSPRRLRSFNRLLADAQHLVGVREEQVDEWTLPWPVMRRAVVRIGEALVQRGVITNPDDVFFLTRTEVLDVLDRGAAQPIDTAARRALRDQQARLVPPMHVGHLNLALRSMWDTYPRMFGAIKSEHAIVTGIPASPGRATGRVRVIRGPDQFDELQPNEILVAPFTAPAWTPLFTRAAAVVTDVGSAAAHASIIAREYGIPAVVGCADATARLATGTLVTVDGATGNVELAVEPAADQPGGTALSGGPAKRGEQDDDADDDQANRPEGPEVQPG
jgi:pyruvate,water dikinase